MWLAQCRSEGVAEKHTVAQGLAESRSVGHEAQAESQLSDALVVPPSRSQAKREHRVARHARLQRLDGRHHPSPAELRQAHKAALHEWAAVAEAFDRADDESAEEGNDEDTERGEEASITGVDTTDHA